ncbi:MAG: hypothetical protein K2G37_01810 [Clostridia bacterium]|nr:hypothetical protein [Clostridia bacterium]MDE7328675.1 hypothetical protein [Clostridia bacterium]
MSDKFKALVEKCRKIKGFEIICAIVIAVLAICVYFSVNAMMGKKESAPASTDQTQEGLIGEIKTILSSIDGVGECEVLITYKYNGEDVSADTLNATDNIQGVVVVAEGGQDVYTRIKITNALCTLLKIEAGNIQIFEMK